MQINGPLPEQDLELLDTAQQANVVSGSGDIVNIAANDNVMMVDEADGAFNHFAWDNDASAGQSNMIQGAARPGQDQPDEIAFSLMLEGVEQPASPKGNSETGGDGSRGNMDNFFEDMNHSFN